MSTPASIAKHPIHPMLVAFPIGLLVFSLICNLIYVFGSSHDPVWTQVALYTMGGGIIGGLIAALPGFVDFLSITDNATKSIAWKHMLANVVGLVLFIIAFWAEYRESTINPVLIFSVLGVLSLSVGGWLGGEMVYVRGLAVDRVDEVEKQQTVVREAVRRAS
jgi:uncharacterized membrane protein